MNTVQQEIDRLYKANFGKLVASLLYSSRDINPETAEDIVHDSFSAALTNWEQHGIPLNATGWLYKVCKHKALNRIRKEKREQGLSGNDDLHAVEMKFSDSILDDQSLKMLFACAHPDLSPKVQVVITLKYVVNLKVEAIAKILGMTLDGVDKLLLRARQQIKGEKILLEEPDTASLRPRLSIVHKIIYLIFNEGYKSSAGKELVREELCEEALLINTSLLKSPLVNHETKALHALMLFNAARIRSRFNDAGELLDLENQDRSQWQQDVIQLATEFFNQSITEKVSSYHLEASIAYVHCTAPEFAQTDWPLIAQLYQKLLQNNPNPFVELNHAVALFYAGEKARAFQILDELHRHPILNQYYLLNAALGKFHATEGNADLGKKFLLEAYSQTNFPAEKHFIRKMIDNC